MLHHWLLAVLHWLMHHHWRLIKHGRRSSHRWHVCHREPLVESWLTRLEWHNLLNHRWWVINWSILNTHLVVVLESKVHHLLMTKHCLVSLLVGHHLLVCGVILWLTHHHSTWHFHIPCIGLLGVLSHGVHDASRLLSELFLLGLKGLYLFLVSVFLGFLDVHLQEPLATFVVSEWILSVVVVRKCEC